MLMSEVSASDDVLRCMRHFGFGDFAAFSALNPRCWIVW